MATASGFHRLGVKVPHSRSYLCAHPHKLLVACGLTEMLDLSMSDSTDTGRSSPSATEHQAAQPTTEWDEIIQLCGLRPCRAMRRFMRSCIPNVLLQTDTTERKSVLLVEAVFLFVVLYTLRACLLIPFDKSTLTLELVGTIVNIMAFLAILPVLNISKQLDLSCGLFVLWLHISIFTALLLEGVGLLSVRFSHYALVPVFACFLLGLSAGILSLIAVITQTIILAACVDCVGFDMLPHTAADTQPAGLVLLGVISILGVGWVALVYERQRRSDFARLATLVDKLRNASLEKSRFLANMSHELRTPLHGIVGMLSELKEISGLRSTGMMIDMAAAPVVRDALRTIEDCADHMLSLISDILDYEKLEQGQMKLEETQFNMQTDVVAKALQIVKVNAAKKGIQVTASVAPELATEFYNGDPLRLRQVIINLLSNAIKFTEKGSVMLQVAKSTSVPASSVGCGVDRIDVTVIDTGKGIAPEKYKELFQHFSQLDASIYRKYGGSGLGLAISHRLVDMMNGKFDVQSEVGKGSKFHFYVMLPLAAVSHSTTGSPTMAVNLSPIAAATPFTASLPSDRDVLHQEQFESSAVTSTTDTEVPHSNKSTTDELSESAATTPPMVFPDKTILVVDDNEVNLKVILRMLAPLKAQMLKAENGLVAVETFVNRNGDIDLIIMDCEMPVMDGFTAARTIRAKESQYSASPVPIIALTASTLPALGTRCSAVGMNGCLPKPIKKEELLNKVKDWLMKPRNRQPIVRSLTPPRLQASPPTDWAAASL